MMTRTLNRHLLCRPVIPLRLISALIIVLIPIAASARSGAEERMRITVNPSVGVAPTDIHITARVAPNDDNRALEVVAESAEFLRSSEEPLDGAAAPRVTSIVFRGLPAGEYLVTATLKAADGTVVVAKRFLRVADPSQ